MPTSLSKPALYARPFRFPFGRNASPLSRPGAIESSSGLQLGARSMSEALQSRCPPITHCRGFSVTELLVATTLLAIVTAGGLTAFSCAHSARREAGQTQQLHERAQYAFATLEAELQLAGYFGPAGAPAALRAADIPEPAQRCGLDLVQRLDLALQVAASWTLPCDPRGDGAVPESDVLTVRRVSARGSHAAQEGRA